MGRTKTRIPRCNSTDQEASVIKKPTKIIVNGHVLMVSPTATCWVCNDDIVINDPHATRVSEAFSRYDLNYQFESTAVASLIRKLENDREAYKKRLESIAEEKSSDDTEEPKESDNIQEDPDHSAFIFS